MKPTTYHPSEIEAVAKLLLKDPSGESAVLYIDRNCRTLPQEMQDDLFFTAEHLAYVTNYESKFLKKEKYERRKIRKPFGQA